MKTIPDPDQKLDKPLYLRYGAVTPVMDNMVMRDVMILLDWSHTSFLCMFLHSNKGKL